MHAKWYVFLEATCALALVCSKWLSLRMMGREALWACVWKYGAQTTSLSAMWFEQKPPIIRPIHPGKLEGFFVRAFGP
jgi:hypothetical protein